MAGKVLLDGVTIMVISAQYGIDATNNVRLASYRGTSPQRGEGRKTMIAPEGKALSKI